MLGAVMSIFDRHGYRVALNNLEVALGDQFSIHERRKIARLSFQHFAPEPYPGKFLSLYRLAELGGNRARHRT